MHKPFYVRPSTVIFYLCICLTFAISAPADEQSHQNLILQADRTEANYNASNQLLKAKKINDYLTSVVNRLIDKEPTAKSLFRIHAMRNDLPYIYCLDNGAIYVSTGLIARLQNEAQFAGLLAPEMAAIFKQNADAKNDFNQERNKPSQSVPSLLAVVFTAGIAAIPIVSKENRLRNEMEKKLQRETDQLAMQWITNAGYDPNQAAAATQRLINTLSAEKRNGTTNYSDLAKLDERNQDLLEAAASIGVFTVQNTDEIQFKYFVKLFGLDLARQDKDKSNIDRFNTVLNRIEAETGKDGETQFLRAEYLREYSITDAQLAEAAKAYEEAATFKNAPVETFRELGMLYRRTDNKVNAKKNFQRYLSLAPNAADAPIINIYLETL